MQIFKRGLLDVFRASDRLQYEASAKTRYILQVLLALRLYKLLVLFCNIYKLDELDYPHPSRGPHYRQVQFKRYRRSAIDIVRDKRSVDE